MTSLSRGLVVICVLAFAHSNTGVSAESRGIEFGPDNTAVLLGSPVLLRCRTDGVPTTNIRWFEYITNPSGAMISDGASILPGHPNNARYEIFNNDSLTYDLYISPTVLADGGYYMCEDSNAAPPSIVRRSANLVIIESQPNCTSLVPTDGFVIEGQYYTAECVVRFKASQGIAPLMTWTGPQPYQTGYTTANTSAWSGAEFTVQRSMDAQNFQCKVNFTTQGFIGPDTAVNAPSWQYIYPDNQMFVHWSPTNMTATPIQASYEIGTTVSCYADANPAATYLWQSLRTDEFWFSQTFTTRSDMVGYQLMRCQARNNLQGLDYTRDFFLDVYVNAPSTLPPSTTPAPTTTVAAVSECPDLTGRWEAVNPAASLCLTVDHDNDARLVGLFMNGSDTYWLQITGRTRHGTYTQAGWSILWPSDSVGVSSYAAECYRCLGEEILMANGISRRAQTSEFCASGGNVQDSATLTFRRVPVSWPCASSVTQMYQNMHSLQTGLQASI